MKKIFFMFLMIFTSICTLPTIKAKVYYSDYSPYSNYTVNSSYTESNDIVSVETRNVNKWYKETKVKGGYYLIGENNSEYPEVDMNDISLGLYTDWSKTKPEDIYGRIVDTRNVYYSRDMKEVRYIDILDAAGSYGSLRITEIEIIAGGSKVNYSIDCSSCNSNFYDFIHNGNIEENMSNVYNGGSVYIDLKNYYPVDSLQIKLYFFDMGYSIKSFNLRLRNDTNIFFTKNEQLEFKYSEFYEIEPYIYTANNMNVNNPEYYNEVYSDNYIVPTVTRLVREEKQYRYQDRLYGYYKTVKEYASGYSDQAIDDYNIPDLEQSQIEYRYRTRDFLSIEDKLIITDPNYKIDELYKSSLPVTISSNIDLTKNGFYDITFKTDFLEKTEKIEVSIADNDKEEKPNDNPENPTAKPDTDKIDDIIKNKDEEIDSLKDKINELINISSSLENNKTISDKENMEKINKYKLEIERLQNELKNKEYEIENKECIETSSNGSFENKKIVMFTGLGFVIFGLILGLYSLAKK